MRYFGGLFVGACFIAVMAGAQAITPKGGDPQAAKVKNPVAASPASIAAGHKIYDAKCALCHGPEGKGNPSGAGEGGPPASDLTRAKFDYGSSDGEIFSVVKNGVLPDLYMPTYDGQIGDTDIWNVVNYVRTIEKK